MMTALIFLKRYYINYTSVLSFPLSFPSSSAETIKAYRKVIRMKTKTHTQLTVTQIQVNAELSRSIKSISLWRY